MLATEINKEFIIGEKVETLELNGTIRIARRDINREYIAKFIHNENKDIITNELLISTNMSDLGIGPKVYDAALSETEGTIIMEKYDGTLADLIFKYQQDKTIPIHEVMEKVLNLVMKMHDNGIVHRDLTSDNILFKKDGSIAIADFGFAIYSTSKTLKLIDLEYINGIKEVAKSIDRGMIFNSKSMIIDDGLSPGLVTYRRFD